MARNFERINENDIPKVQRALKEADIANNMKAKAESKLISVRRTVEPKVRKAK